MLINLAYTTRGHALHTYTHTHTYIYVHTYIHTRIHFMRNPGPKADACYRPSLSYRRIAHSTRLRDISASSELPSHPGNTHGHTHTPHRIGQTQVRGHFVVVLTTLVGPIVTAKGSSTY